MRHGPVDRVKAKKPGEPAEGDAPFKSCPECQTYVHAAVRVCPDCGYEWPAPIPKIDRRAAEDAVLSSQIEAKPVWIDRVTYSRHQKRGKPDSLKVEYWVESSSGTPNGCASNTRASLERKLTSGGAIGGRILMRQTLPKP